MRRWGLVAALAVVLVANRLENNIGRPMSGEADEPDSPRALQASRHGQTAARADRPLERLLIVDSMNGKQVEVIDPEPFHGVIEIPKEVLRIGLRNELGLK